MTVVMVVVVMTMVVSVMTEDYHFGYLLTGGGTWRYTSPHHTFPYRQRAHQGQYLYSSLLVFMDLSSLRVHSTDKRITLRIVIAVDTLSVGFVRDVSLALLLVYSNYPAVNKLFKNEINTEVR